MSSASQQQRVIVRVEYEYKSLGVESLGVWEYTRQVLTLAHAVEVVLGVSAAVESCRSALLRDHCSITLPNTRRGRLRVERW